MKLSTFATAMGCLLSFSSLTASAAPIVVDAGQTHTLQADLVLNGDDVLEIKGTADKPCVLAGNAHVIRSGAKWTGSIRITHCTIQKLGATGTPGIDLKQSGNGSIVIEHCALDACSTIQIQNDDSSATRFRNNNILETSTVAMSKDIANAAHCFIARGNSRQPKVFQGNFVPRGKIIFNAPNWLIGGDTDADGNILIGLRIGVVADGEGSVVRGNYFHLLMPITKEYPYWSQISVFTTGPKVIGEHNVIRDGEWIVRFVEGEFRYNLISDINDHDMMQNGSNGRIHHNLFVAGTSPHRQGTMSACIMVIYPPKTPGEGIEVFNNVFDGGNRLDVPGIEVAPKAFVKSVRNNVFFNFAHSEKYFKLPQATIRPIWNDEHTGADKPARLGYADYNLFFNPAAKSKRNYLLSVGGKAERKEAGFGLNDIPRGGQIDEQAEPRFKGPLPKSFPFTDDDIKSRKVTISKVLALYRDAYTPGEGSPLIGGGDPADGEGTNIGAIGSVKPSALDRFGKFGSKE